MTRFYFYLVLLNAGVSFAVAAAVYWRNRFQPVGPTLGATMLVAGIWLVGFAQYFQSLAPQAAMDWTRFTLSCSIMVNPMFFHSMVALVEQLRRYRWWIIASYLVGLAFLVLLWQGHIVTTLRQPSYMHHYPTYNRTFYPLLGLHIMSWQLFGAGILAYQAHRAIGYKRTQLVYFIIAWLIVSLTTNSILLPLEYNINVQPFGFLLLPINLGFLAYVMSKARMADYNVVISRVLLYAVMIMIVAGVSYLFAAGAMLVAPKLMNQPQMTFAVLLATTIGIGVTLFLPRFLPRAERIMQERLFGTRAGYQDALSGLVRRLSTLPTIDELFSTVATTVHTQMQLSRVIVMMEDPLSGQYRLAAESGANLANDATIMFQPESPLIQWLKDHTGIMVAEEVARQVPERVMQQLEVDLEKLGTSVCIPIMMEDKLTGFIALGDKTSGDMYFISDLNLLNNLAVELALVFRYRRVEEEIFHKNKLIELGTIAAGVAHELRNPLASIRTFAQLLPEKQDDPDFKNEFSKLVLNDVDRITRVIESMLTFSRPGQVSLTDQSTSDLVEEAVMLTQPRLKSKRIDLKREFHETPQVKVDKQKILQVLINLIQNATDALPDRGQIRIATGVRTMDTMAGGNGQRRFAAIEVSDNGPGIPAAIRNRLFDPFFTTKKEGTGLGLSISQKIVRDHGGLITVSSTEGKGTTFQVNLPLG